MVARAIIASLALLGIAGAAFAQDAVIYVETANRTHENLISLSEFEKLVTELQSTKSDALLLYTDFASRAGNDLKIFLRNITGFADNIIRNLDAEGLHNESDECWVKFEYRMKKIEHDARRAAVYNGDMHHKFLLGHLIVFRMHINKSEDYLQRCDKATRRCGMPCEITPRVRRWRRLALEEIHRVREDLPFSRRSYRDIVCHARRKLNHLKKQAITRSRDTVQEYKYCIGRG